MNIVKIDLLLRVLVAHLFFYFIINPSKFHTTKKQRSITKIFLYSLFYVLLLTIAIVDIDLLFIGVMFFLFLTISWLSSNKESILNKFMFEQIIYFFAIVVWWLIYTEQTNKFYDFIASFYSNKNIWAVILGLILLVSPSSILVKKIIRNLNIVKETSNSRGSNSEGIGNAGKYIGIIERILIFIFILVGKFEAIGFLLAAKSVFRFGDIKNTSDRARTEYILIGTFLSFLIAIIIGLGVKLILIN